MGQLLASVVVVIVTFAAEDTAEGTRFPDAVEQRLVFSGEAVTSVAHFFDLNPESPAVSLRLGRGDAWAIYLLKKDTEEQLLNDNNGSPARYNEMQFSLSSRTPTLSISPYWLDLGTRQPGPVANRYVFNSPFVSRQLDGDDPWTNFVRRAIADPGWDEKADSMKFNQCVMSLEGHELCVSVFIGYDYGHGAAEEVYIAGVSAQLNP